MPVNVLEALPPVAPPTLGGQGDEVGRRLTGYVAKYNVPSHPIRNPAVHHRPFVEVIRPGAFDRHLASRPNIPALVNHDKHRLLARTGRDWAGTLQLRSDPTGLHYGLLLPRNTVGDDVRESIERGDFEGGSIGFYSIRDEILPRTGPTDVRLIYEARLHEITPVCTFPAYGQTELALRDTDGTPLLPPSRPHYELRRRRFDLT